MYVSHIHVWVCYDCSMERRREVKQEREHFFISNQVIMSDSAERQKNLSVSRIKSTSASNNVPLLGYVKSCVFIKMSYLKVVL